MANYRIILVHLITQQLLAVHACSFPFSSSLLFLLLLLLLEPFWLNSVMV